MRILEYGIPIAIICILCLLIGKVFVWYVGEYHYAKAISVLNKLADLVMSDEEYRDFLKYQLQHHESVIAEIDAVLEGTDKPMADAETRPKRANQTISEQADKGEILAEESKL